MSWGDSDANDSKRWMLMIQDTGPGLPISGSAPLASALASKPEMSVTADMYYNATGGGRG